MVTVTKASGKSSTILYHRTEYSPSLAFQSYNMSIFTFWVALICTFSIGAAAGIGSGPPVHFELGTETGQKYSLKLTKAEQNVLHSNIKVVTVHHDNDDDDGESGKVSFDTWAPSEDELEAAQNIYIDENNLAAVRLKHDDNGRHELQGLVDGRAIKTSDEGKLFLSERSSSNHSDYIDLGRNITSSMNIQAEPTEAIIEIAVVCDREFGEVFQFDRTKILDYFTVYFWDLNLRYRTLPSVKMSFRVTAVVIITTPAGQPFIEEARAADGRTEHGRILDRFSDWIYTQMGQNTLPKFDVAVVMTNSRGEWGGGLAWGRGACWSHHGIQRYYGTAVFNDAGDWASITVGAHEIAHTVGAPHDDDPNFPGGCQDRGYIMSGATDELRFFFSTCSDRTMGAFARSNEGACLRRIDENGSPPISPDFSFILAPTMDEQCRMRLKNPNAFVADADKSNCKRLRCRVPNNGFVWNLEPVDNTPCSGGGRCFRGRCRKPASLILNVGTGQCMKAVDLFYHNSEIVMAACPNPGTPLDRFMIYDESNGKRLAVPYSTPDAKEIGEICAWTGNAEGNGILCDRCKSENPWHGWDFLDVGNGEFLLQHRVTKRCAKANGTSITTHGNCNGNDRAMRWKLQ